MTMLSGIYILYVAVVFSFIARYLATGKKPWRPWQNREDAHGWDHIVGASAIDVLTMVVLSAAGGPPVTLCLGAIVFGGREEWQWRSGKTWDNIGYWYPVCASIMWSVLSLLIALVILVTG